MKTRSKGITGIADFRMPIADLKEAEDISSASFNKVAGMKKIEVGNGSRVQNAVKLVSNWKSAIGNDLWLTRTITKSSV